MEAVRELYDDFIRTFGNVLFAVLLFIVWGLLTLIGVIIGQGKDPSAYFDSYAAPVARLILRLDFNNIYHTPYYVGIIGLILLSLAVCTFKRVIPARLPPLRAVAIDKIPLHASFDAAGDPETIRERIAAFFRARGWNGRKRELGGVEWTFADKHNWAGSAPAVVRGLTQIFSNYRTRILGRVDQSAIRSVCVPGRGSGAVHRPWIRHHLDPRLISQRLHDDHARRYRGVPLADL